MTKRILADVRRAVEHRGRVQATGAGAPALTRSHRGKAPRAKMRAAELRVTNAISIRARGERYWYDDAAISTALVPHLGSLPRLARVATAAYLATGNGALVRAAISHVGALWLLFIPGISRHVPKLPPTV